MRLRLAAMLMPAVAIPCAAQPARSDSARPPSACWTFSFGTWNPPLDWNQAGHPGDIATTAAAVRKARDSVFAKDAAAVNSNAMTMERVPEGVLLMLYPEWWPAGVRVLFDSIVDGGREMRGTAVAMVAHGEAVPPATPARARQVDCHARQP